MDCDCKECRKHRELVESIKRIKATWPEPVFDWEDLEARERTYRDRVKRQFKRNGRLSFTR
jgi:hypothetical protein